MGWGSLGLVLLGEVAAVAQVLGGLEHQVLQAHVGAAEAELLDTTLVVPDDGLMEGCVPEPVLEIRVRLW